MLSGLKSGVQILGSEHKRQRQKRLIMMNQSSTSGYWQVCPPPQTSGRRKEEKRHASATQRYDAQNLQVRIRHRTISSAAENESDELENVNEGIAGFISKLYR